MISLNSIKLAKIGLFFPLLPLLSQPAFAQMDLSGDWAIRMHEDEPWRGPGPELGEYEEAAQRRGQAGETIEPVKAAQPTQDYDPRYGTPAASCTKEMFIEAVYADLSHAKTK